MSVSLVETGVKFPNNSIQTTAYVDYAALYTQLTTLQTTITSTQTYTIPAGVTAIRIEIWGGGGGGSSGTCCKIGRAHV